MKIYPLIGGKPTQYNLRWNFSTGMHIRFAHLEYDKDVLAWQGSEVPWFGFDELTHFSMASFFYMLSRNRSTSGVSPRIRAATNPNPDSWVRKFIAWWIGPDGFAIKERSGVIRWFIRRDDTFIWADSPDEIYAIYGRKADVIPKSVTFIPSKLDDNRILMEKDPAYLGNLLALNRVDRMRLLEGNWDVRASAGMYFQRGWFKVVDAIPPGWIQVVRFWDRAATKPHEGNSDPDWTRGLKMYKYPNNTFLVADLKSMRDTPLQVERLIKNTASQDSHGVKIVSQQDPGSSGVQEAENFTRMLAGYSVYTRRFDKDKETRAKPVSAQSEAGNVFVLRAPWNDEFFSELENFPGLGHDDIVDTFSGSFNELSGGLSLADVL